jgi:hypothetical protein
LRISPDELSRIRWKGDGAYRALSYYFTVRWNRARLGKYITQVLEPFAVAPDPGRKRNPPTPGLPPAYSVIDLGPERMDRYQVLYGEDVMVAAEKSDQALRQLFRHINLESCWQTGDFLLVHAGAVVTPAGEGVLLPGGSGSGKTTLTAGLMRAGFGYLSDEAGALDPVTRRLYPYPRTLCLKEGSFELFAELNGRNATLRRLGGEWYVRPESIRPGVVGGACEVRFVMAPRYQEGSVTKLTPMSRADAITELWDNLWNRAVYRERALRLLADLMVSAQGFRLVYGDLDQAVDTIKKLTGSRR